MFSAAPNQTVKTETWNAGSILTAYPQLVIPMLIVAYSGGLGESNILTEEAAGIFGDANVVADRIDAAKRSIMLTLAPDAIGAKFIIDVAPWDSLTKNPVTDKKAWKVLYKTAQELTYLGGGFGGKLNRDVNPMLNNGSALRPPEVPYPWQTVLSRLTQLTVDDLLHTEDELYIKHSQHAKDQGITPDVIIALGRVHRQLVLDVFRQMLKKFDVMVSRPVPAPSQASGDQPSNIQQAQDSQVLDGAGALTLENPIIIGALIVGAFMLLRR